MGSGPSQRVPEWAASRGSWAVWSLSNRHLPAYPTSRWERLLSSGESRGIRIHLPSLSRLSPRSPPPRAQEALQL